MASYAIHFPGGTAGIIKARKRKKDMFGKAF